MQFLDTITEFVPTSRETPASQSIFFGTSIVMIVCIVFSVFIGWLENLLDDGVIEKLGVTRIKRIKIRRPSIKKAGELDVLIPRRISALDVQRDFLFGEATNEIGSCALVPLGEKCEIGFLAIGSADAERFHPGMSIDFITRLGELISSALARY